MSKEVEIVSPLDAGVDPYLLVGYLRGTLRAGQTITVDVWNDAIEYLKEQKK